MMTVMGGESKVEVVRPIIRNGLIASEVLDKPSELGELELSIERS